MKLHRALRSKPVWTDSTPEQKVVLITLLLLANFEEKEWEWEGKMYISKPRQFITSLASLEILCGKKVSVQNIRTAIKRFEKFGYLTNKSTRQNRLITIVKWDFY
ncbi:hypothetical protein H9649_00155 [Sporosarcina sp. Sa2YVA2]|uniref:DNA replication protein DnaD n=1 Tax=Sporosarcina quadrami TaxID=2762234 RepID=A0ABR8U4K5_9BACL|nr:hypothetical protein [Sporosarcina quadrami]MBD7982974.1 hypothetical protein [Sporosarcina quadrami]